jgi:DNA replication protein DnaC
MSDYTAELLTALPSSQRSGGRCAYGLCEGDGFVIDEATNTASDCRCRAGRIAQRRTANLEGRVPRKYSGVSFDRPPVPGMPEPVVSAVRRYVGTIDARLDEGRGLWFVGDIGTGKTTLAMIVSKAALDVDRSVAIYSLPRLLSVLRESMDSDGGLLGFMDRLTAVDLLHIDDLGAEMTTEWVLEQLYSIINARYESERAVVATTNLMPDKLAEQIGARTVSRLMEMCGEPLPLWGEDRRQERPVALAHRSPATAILDAQAYSA